MDGEWGAQMIEPLTSSRSPLYLMRLMPSASSVTLSSSPARLRLDELVV